MKERQDFAIWFLALILALSPLLMAQSCEGGGGGDDGTCEPPKTWVRHEDGSGVFYVCE